MFTKLFMVAVLLMAVTEVVLFIKYFDPLMEILEEIFKQNEK